VWLQVNPKQLLEDGIRRELVAQTARAMDETLVFARIKPGELEQRLAVLALRLDGFRRSFECMSLAHTQREREREGERERGGVLGLAHS
jgi:hypothetical protein